MCGIAGILAFQNHETLLQSDLVVQMRDRMAHRGPDDAGVFRDNHIALAQRRLSIIDLAGGFQPMSNVSETIWVLNNGEIYNYQSLRRRLEEDGYDFHTESDTEVIVQGYAAYDEGVFGHLRGMFATAIWDADAGKLLLGRDRTGQKPLYYAHLPEGLFFASELKSLLAYQNMPRQLDYDALSDYFTYQSVPAPKTIFKAVKKLPPAHYLTIDTQNHLDIKRYWRWSLEHQHPTTLSYDDAKQELRQQLSEAVRLRMISDVPLGALLSGGVDSSAVVAMMRRHATGAVKTFSIGFSQASYDERPYARAVAEFCQTDHHELLVKPEHIHEMLPKLAYQNDEPFADISSLPTYYVCKMAREHVTVALAGDGGDESFAGYDRYAKFLRLHKQFDPMPLSEIAGQAVSRLVPLGIVGRRTARLLAEPLAERYQRMNTLFEPPHLAKLLGTHAGPAQHLITERMAHVSNLSLQSQLQFADLELYLPSTVLTKVDRASMLNSLEVRAPLLDHELLDFIGTLPPEWVYQKRILKDAIRADVPEIVLSRPKAGFGIPLEHWFSGDFGSFLREILLDGQTARRGILNVRYVERLIGRQARPWGELTGHLWALLMFELWCRAYDIS